MSIEQLPEWLNSEKVNSLVKKHGTPLYVYSRETLKKQAEEALSMKIPYGFTVRYAMKANSHPEILKLFKQVGLNIDASSGYEAEKALQAGFAPQQILITSQELPKNLKQLVQKGLLFNATSLHQLKTFCTLFPGHDVCVRINPGVGDGFNNRNTTGGANSSFGIWHEYIPDAKRITSEAGCKVTRLHTHIGTGTNPEKWAEAGTISLKLVQQFPDVKTLNLGGGFKVAYMLGDSSVNMADVSERLSDTLQEFAKKTGRNIHLEIEPGRFLVAEAGVLIASVIDKTDTGKQGNIFLRVNTGMNDLVRPGMYGAQHPIITVKQDGTPSSEAEEVLVAGHNCESTDILTPYPGDPEKIQSRQIGKAEIGDLIVIGVAGAYGHSMASAGYNSYPSAKEVLI